MTGRPVRNLTTHAWLVTRVVEAVMTEPEEKEEPSSQPKPLRQAANGELWEPFWEPQGGKPGQTSMEVVEKNGRL